MSFYIYYQKIKFASKSLIGEHFKLAKEMTHGFQQCFTPRRFWHIAWMTFDETLSSMGFFEDFHRILDRCYQTTSYFVLYDGESTTRFSNQRGIQQGDPIFPILFNITMEKLS